LEEKLSDVNIYLSKTDVNRVRGYLRNDPAYQALANDCLALLKGVFLSYFIIVLVTFLAPQDSTLVRKSRLAPVIIASYQTVVGLIPPGFHEKLKKSFDKQKNNLQYG